MMFVREALKKKLLGISIQAQTPHSIINGESRNERKNDLNPTPAIFTRSNKFVVASIFRN